MQGLALHVGSGKSRFERRLLGGRWRAWRPCVPVLSLLAELLVRLWAVGAVREEEEEGRSPAPWWGLVLTVQAGCQAPFHAVC